MDQRDNQRPDTTSGQKDEFGQEQQRGPSDAGQASYGNSGQPESDQAPATADTRLDQTDTLTEQDRADDGHAESNPSFDGTTLGDPSSEDDNGTGVLFGKPDDSSTDHIDPTTGQRNERGFGRDGQGAADPSTNASESADDRAAPPPLDGE